MRVLLLGYSSIGRRRVLPALAAIGVTRVDVATRSQGGSVALPDGLSGRVFDDYDDALRRSEAEVVYISTVNSQHAAQAATALEHGRHVVIDKPATTHPADLHRLVDLARRKGLLLAEATVYAHHPQIDAIRAAFAEAGDAPTRLLAAFSFPPLPPDNFRHRAELGGGVLLDLGPYAVSVGRLFFGDAPTELIARGDDRAFSLMAVYPGGRTMVGQFGMGTGYVNRLELLGADVTVSAERVFTVTPDMDCTLRVTRRNQPQPLTVPAADCFAEFLKAVLAAIDRGDTDTFLPPMLADADAVHRLRSGIRPAE
ncbi:Gfo/Idh/MocA family protein [Azospirillum sp. sgz302134]